MERLHTWDSFSEADLPEKTAKIVENDGEGIQLGVAMNATWRVSIVKPDSQCASQGIGKGDVLVGINGKSLEDMQVTNLGELMERLGSMPLPLDLNFNKLPDKSMQLNAKFMGLLSQGMEMKVRLHIAMMTI